MRWFIIYCILCTVACSAEQDLMDIIHTKEECKVFKQAYDKAMPATVTNAISSRVKMCQSAGAWDGK